MKVRRDETCPVGNMAFLVNSTMWETGIMEAWIGLGRIPRRRATTAGNEANGCDPGFCCGSSGGGRGQRAAMRGQSPMANCRSTKIPSSNIVSTFPFSRQPFLTALACPSPVSPIVKPPQKKSPSKREEKCVLQSGYLCFAFAQSIN